MSLGVKLGPLTERPFRLLWLGRTTSSIGDALVPVALAFAVLQVGGGATWLGLVLGVGTLTWALALVVGGVWADRLPRRLLMLGCDVVRAAADALLAALLFSGEMRAWMFLCAAVVFGAAGGFFAPAATGILPETISPGRLQQANALLTLSQSAARVFGPAASGAIVALAAPAWVFVIDSASFGVSAAFLVALRVAPHAAKPARRFAAELVDGLREIRGRRWLWASFLTFAITNIGVGPFFVLGPVIARDNLGGAQGWGAIAAGVALGGVVGGVLAYRLRPGRPLVACFGAWLFAGLPVVALVPPLPTTAVAAAALGLGLGLAFSNTIWETVLQREIPAARLGRVAAIEWTVSLVFMPIGQVLAGPLSSWIGMRTTLFLAAAFVVLPALFMLQLGDVRKMRGPAQVSSATAPVAS